MITGTQCDQIQSFDRGHPGGVNFDLVSLIHGQVRVGSLPLRNKKLNGPQVTNNKSVWDKYVGLNLNGM